ncbi:DedA family protein [Rhodococcoides corynebacterioides]|uniref:DedA family protein n=1 Tax=Rhodococcoides corynebacterioides TaxID=53972 RepID=UPI001C9B27D5|nr:DedA family protein [Rhodococcus corynebacterioides]MBY6350455.1 DedA family protein [Rhodococcus corynebacterioides]MBY6363340.1 DedA family protein [Rhodococcus corynebacterioides]
MSDTVTAAASTELGGIAGWAVGLMEAIGGPGAGLAVAAENFFPPLPSEIILPLAGFTASQGGFSLFSALFWTTLGSVVGAAVLYWLGVKLGRDRLYAIVDRMPLVDTDDLSKAEDWFARHGRSAVFFGRMIPMVRSGISVPAGVARMPFWQFLLYTTAGSLLWNSIFVLAGYYLGENWHYVENYASVFQYVVIGLVVALVGWFVTKKVRSRSAA